MIEKADVIIVGSGSAGLCAATWLARQKIACKILEKRSGPLTIGQADGVQCRTVEVFESFGISEELLREAYHVLEVVFWSADEKTGKLRRTGRTADTMPGLSHQPHVILNQGRINGLLLDAMMRFNNQTVDYGVEVKDVKICREEDHDYPVKVIAERQGLEEIYRAKYVLGCDGAHSSVRKSLRYRMIGDSTDAVWGVMDVYPQTDFPDIRKKATIHSKSGNLLIIPREGDSLVRCYIELPQNTVPSKVHLTYLHSMAQRIFQPYTFKVAQTMWWSSYLIGQRLVEKFHLENLIFLTGDACHTHSPKAGQGMNVSLQDGYNLGWKLAAVLHGRARPEVLQTYNAEREKVAADLIAFDHHISKLFSSRSDETTRLHGPNYFAEQFIKAGRYTAGLTAKYEDSIITSAAKSIQEAAVGIPVGMRLASAQVVRFCDAKAMQLVKALPADGRWRILVFAGAIRNQSNAKSLDRLSRYLSSSRGPILRYTSPGSDVNSFIDSILILYGNRTSIEQEEIPSHFCPVGGTWKMKDLTKVFIDDESYNHGHGQAYQKYAIDVMKGAVVIVRPDHYVSLVTDMEHHQVLGTFFDMFAVPTFSSSRL